MHRHKILVDGRWKGAHGIGRFSSEVLPRLQEVDIFTTGPNPLTIQNIFWQPYQLHKHKKTHKVFFTPGFNPVWCSTMPAVFTVHDLIHLHIPGKAKWLKRIFYETILKPAIHRAYKVLTVSNYSKQTIIEWAGVPESQIVVIGNGISSHLTQEGYSYQPGYPYLLHVGNTKPHKNLVRLIQAFAQAKIDPKMHLILTGKRNPELMQWIKKCGLENRVIFSGVITDSNLAAYYRGAVALVFPSLYEGFGLPPLEAMACGTPALTSNVTALPEVVGDAAVLVQPYEIDSIAEGLERIVNDTDLRESLIKKGLHQAAQFSWDKTAQAVQTVLNQALSAT